MNRTFTPEILEALSELKQRIEDKYGIRSSVDVFLWYPPLAETEFEGNWNDELHGKETGDTSTYRCRSLYGNHVSATVYLSDDRQDGEICPVCNGDGYYWEDVVGDGRTRGRIVCECGVEK